VRPCRTPALSVEIDPPHFALRPTPRIAPAPTGEAGAGDGNRTHVSSLGSCSSTIELHPRRGGILYVSGVRAATPVVLQGSTSFPLAERKRRVARANAAAKVSIQLPYA